MSDMCPICGRELEGSDDYSYDPHYLAESNWVCPRGHYAYDYAYGAGRTSIGDVEVFSSYRDTSEEMKHQSAAEDAEVARMRRWWYEAWWQVKRRTRVLWYARGLKWRWRLSFRRKQSGEF